MNPLPAVLLLAAALLPEGGPPPAAVRVEPVRKETLRLRRTVTGDVRAVRRSLVAAREAGVLLELAVREGETVAAGAVIARVDDERLRLDLAVLEAEGRSAAATLEEMRSLAEKARRDLETLSGLADRGATNPREVADAATEARTAEARVAGAERDAEVVAARAAVLRRRVADAVVRAPFAGEVASRRVEVGQWVREGDPVAEIVATGELEAWLEVPQRDLAAIAGGGTVEVVVDATGAVLEVPSWRVVRDVDARTRTFRLVAPLPAGSALVPGMSLSARVPAGEEGERFTVSRDALLRGETGPYLYAAEGGGEGKPAAARMIPVEVLFGIGSRAAVKGEGLREGLLAVVEGNERIFPGAPLLPSPRDGPGAPSGALEGGGR
ncbi:MAG: efflux RND transporter periplasmic adaptor subunit [Planctomycetes bacterium]|nr:efflux RND transporter periplasmic adaptor subunit [Planctomycetota bacterium]